MPSITLLRQFVPLLLLNASLGSSYAMETREKVSFQDNVTRTTSSYDSSYMTVEDFEKRCGFESNERTIYPVEDLLFRIYPNVLLANFRSAINHEKFIHCRLTRQNAQSFLSVLSKHDVTPEMMIHELSINKMICEPGAAEGTIHNEGGPKNAILFEIGYMMYKPALFEEAGVSFEEWSKYSRDSGGVYWLAHQYGVRAHIDPEKFERVPMRLTAQELSDYELHHTFRQAAFTFYESYTKLLGIRKFYLDNGRLPNQDDQGFARLLGKERQSLTVTDESMRRVFELSRKFLNELDNDLALKKQQHEEFEKTWKEDDELSLERKRDFYTVGKEIFAGKVSLYDLMQKEKKRKVETVSGDGIQGVMAKQDDHSQMIDGSSPTSLHREIKRRRIEKEETSAHEGTKGEPQNP